MQIEELSQSSQLPENNYLYNGKELDDEFGLNWYHYGARLYDPAIGRFTGVDPISDQFPWVSTYNYAENEPVGSIDLWGLQRWKVSNTTDADGNTSEAWEWQQDGEPVDGVYVEQIDYQSGSGRTYVASYEDYSEQFPNFSQGVTGDNSKPIVSFELYGQLLFGEVGLDIPTSAGNVGVEFGVEGNLAKVNLSTDSGVEFTSIFSGDTNLKPGGGASLFAGLEHREEFNTERGAFTGNRSTTASTVFGKAKLGFDGGGGPQGSHFSLGIPEFKASLGFGVKAGAFININIPPKFSEFEKKVNKSN